MFRNPTTDAVIVLLIVLLIFGPKRLPGLGKQLGQGLREFKDSITGDSKDSEESERPQLPAQGAASSPVAPPAEAAPHGTSAADGSTTQSASEPAEVASSERRA
jgi:sec-independent protein translocase protein TatA